ncbi:MAG: hypothetical protein HRU20_09820, partial [Pseudomonadales bacterium]|nr:hypothetical protein [Pseudomonadales bacterium]
TSLMACNNISDTKTINTDNKLDTIAGIVTSQLGHIPQRNETVEMHGFTFKVLQADNRRMHLLRLSTPQLA